MRYEIAERDVKVFRDQKLGQGGYGVVYKGQWQGRGVAVKVLLCELTGEVEAEFRRELDVMLDLRAPQVIHTYGAVLEGSHHALVMELMPNGNVYDLLRRERDLPWSQKYQIALDVAYGLKYLHDRSILHRDLKSLNVLLDKERHARLCDFGLAKVKTATSSKSTKREGAVGTVLWMAPELFARKVEFSRASDIYALAMVFYELLTHQVPFESDLDGRDPGAVLSGWLAQGERPDLALAGVSTEGAFKELIEACWVQTPGDRPGIQQVIDALAPLVEEHLSQAMGGLSMESASATGADSGIVVSSGAHYGGLMFSEVPKAPKVDSTLAAERAAFEREKVELARQKAEVRVATQAKLFKAPKLDPRLNQAEVDRFVTHVARGEQDAAEAMLKANKALALGQGHAAEHSGREFRNITGFQYALWALDWHMWDMIQGYMDEEVIREQVASQESLTEAQGQGGHYDFTPLLDALQKYVDNYDSWRKARNWDAMGRCWIHEVGGAQRAVPAHVAQEYCHPNRGFDPIPDFDKKPFKRSLETDGGGWRPDGGEWWTAQYNGGGLGGDGQSSRHGYALVRSLASAPERVKPQRGNPRVSLSNYGMTVDRAAVTQLFKNRTLKLEKLKQAFGPHVGARP